jgi:hypothetical protein
METSHQDTNMPDTDGAAADIPPRASATVFKCAKKKNASNSADMSAGLWRFSDGKIM